MGRAAPKVLGVTMISIYLLLIYTEYLMFFFLIRGKVSNIGIIFDGLIDNNRNRVDIELITD